MSDPYTIGQFNGQYMFLSNFHECKVHLDGDPYPSTEHAYQAAKTLDMDERRAIANCGSASKAKKMGRNVQLRPGWEAMKVEVMRRLLLEKFSKEPFKTWLLNTGSAILVEGNTWGDKFWGVCKGVGQNHLGQLLMEIRQGLRP
jgi:ribA/ribD-fused uncharacterized protein